MEAWHESDLYSTVERAYFSYYFALYDRTTISPHRTIGILAVVSRPNHPGQAPAGGQGGGIAGNGHTHHGKGGAGGGSAAGDAPLEQHNHGHQRSNSYASGSNSSFGYGCSAGRTSSGSNNGEHTYHLKHHHCCNCSTNNGSSNSSTGSSTTTSEFINKLIMKLRIFSKSSCHLPFHQNGGSSSSMAAFYKIVWGGCLLVCCLVALFTYHVLFRRSGHLTISYSPSKARVAGLSVSSQLMGAHDCIPADMLLGGALGSVGKGRGVVPSPSRDNGSSNSSSSSSSSSSSDGDEALEMQKEGEDATVERQGEGDATTVKQSEGEGETLEEEEEEEEEEGEEGQENVFSSTRSPTATSQNARAIPMIATNLDFDTEKYLTRFMSGIDAPVRHKLIAWGGCDPLVAEQVNWVLETHPETLVYRARKTLGCAGGWNTILQYMSMHDDIPWVIIFNNDMYTPKGSLKAFGEEIWAHIDSDPNFCVGLFNTRGAGTLGRYTAFVYTRHALNTLGTFDGNIYPAYYEDVELDIRIARAQREGVCSPFRTFNSSQFVHGKQTKKYLSGSKIVQQRMMAYGDETMKAIAMTWSEKIKRGKLASPLYLQEKWGCKNEVNIDINSCTYDHPFNNPEYPLSHWVLDAERRQCIDESKGQVTCPYHLNRD